MTLHFGDVPAGSTLYIPFTTYDKTNGASVTMTGLAVTDIEIYKNGSTTQRASDTGYALLDTDGIDFDAITGLHGFSIDLSSNADAGFFAVGSFYWVVVSTITIDSQTVTFIPATFRIVAAETTAGYPKSDAQYVGGTTQTGRDLGASVLLSSGTGTGQLDFTSGVVKANLVQILASAISGTAAQISAAFTKFFDKATPTGTINSLPDAVAGATNGLFIAGTNAATTVTTALTTTFTGNLTGSVGSVASGGIAAASFAAGAINAAAIADAAIDNATFAADTACKVLHTSTMQAGSGATTAILNVAASDKNSYYDGAILQITGGTAIGQSRIIGSYVGSTRTATILEAWATNPVVGDTYVILPLGDVEVGFLMAGAITATSIATGAITNAKFAAGAIDAAAIAAGAIDNATFAADVGSTAYATNIIALAADKAIVNAALATQASVNTIDDFLDTEVAAILADTNELQTDWVQGGRLDLILDIIAADTTTDIPALIGTAQGNITDILADTAELQAEWADGGRSDLILDIIAADTTTDIPALIGTAQGNITSILADTGELQTDWVQGGRLDLILDIIAADTTTDIPALIADVPTVDEILDEVVEGTLTMRQVLRILLSKAALKAAGGGTESITFRDVADGKNRIALTVDSSGNRSAVTLDGT